VEEARAGCFISDNRREAKRDEKMGAQIVPSFSAKSSKAQKRFAISKDTILWNGFGLRNADRFDCYG
jgi:hypothetical protein